MLGIGAYLHRVSPRSERACEAWKRLEQASFLPPERQRREIERLRRLDSQLSPALIATLGDDLSGLPSLQRPFRRLGGAETLRDADFFELKRFLYHAVSLMEAADGLDELPESNSPVACRFRQAMETLHPEQAGSNRFHLADELDPQLARRRQQLRATRQQFRDRRQKLESEIADEVGGRFDIHGRFTPDDGDVDDDRLTLKDGSYVVDDQRLRELDTRLEQHREEVRQLEHQQRRRLTEVIAGLREDIERVRAQLVQFDLRITRLQLRRQVDGCWPEIVDDGPWLQIEQGRLPALLETMDAGDVQPVDVQLHDRSAVVLGPNMGGKSTLLQLAGLAAWCARLAIPVPATVCRVGKVARIVYIGSEQPDRPEPTEGLSSFGREIRRFTRFWDGVPPTLWLLDEPCRGTHPDEGTRLAAGIVRRLFERGDRVVAATHFPGLADQLPVTRLRIAGITADRDQLQEAIDDAEARGEPLEQTLRQLMDYRVIEDPDGRVPRDGRRIARALGLDIPVSGE